MSILTVGTGSQYEYHTIAAAVAAAQSGDTVDVAAGTYTNDFVHTAKSLTLQAIGGVVTMVATVSPPDEKAIITEGSAGGSFTINGFDISGAAVSAGAGGNGAGIRYQGGNLTLNNDYIHNNQDGMLAASDPNGVISINNSEFAYNGAGDGKTHNLYVNDVQMLKISGSYFHDADVGHEIKSRAENTVITNTRVFDNNSTASYSIDLPNGGNATITNDTIEQGPNSQNPIMMAYGEEGNLHTGTTVTIADNTIVNDENVGNALGLMNRAPNAITLTGNQIYGLTGQQLVDGPATVAGNVYLQTRPALDTSSHWQPADPPAVPVGTGTIGDPTSPGFLSKALSQPLLSHDASGSHGTAAGTSESNGDSGSNAIAASGDGSGGSGLRGLFAALHQAVVEVAALRFAAGGTLSDMPRAVGGVGNWSNSLQGQGPLAMMGAPGSAMG